MIKGAIGVFDSGIGGIPVLVKLKKAFPEDDFIYLGDNGNVPYGNKSAEEIYRLTLFNVKKLIRAGAGVIVIACNTASLNWRGGNALNGVNVIKLIPYVDEKYLNASGIFLGTASSVGECKRSGIFSSFSRTAFIPLENLAAEVENKLGGGEGIVLSDHFLTTVEKPVFLYLGCTHYLYIQEELKAYTGAETTLDGIDRIIENII
ncbi:MAG: aspartate/glutamate racemase family protein, partial [Clostridia bacterium]|nr:aspartate/glutamate racemase family protein [Clostridia bacterium]